MRNPRIDLFYEFYLHLKYGQIQYIETRHLLNNNTPLSALKGWHPLTWGLYELPYLYEQWHFDDLSGVPVTSGHHSHIEAASEFFSLSSKYIAHCFWCFRQRGFIGSGIILPMAYSRELLIKHLEEFIPFAYSPLLNQPKDENP